MRVPGYLAGIERGATNPRAVPRIERDDGATAVVDGDLGLGQVVARVAADQAVARARAHGVSCVVVRRCCHIGRLAHFAERIADEGQIGIVVANDAGAGQVVAPPGSGAARLATNPLAVAAPRSGAPPFVLDMSTSVVSHGKIRIHRERGEEVPGDWAVDGVLQLLGGYKGLGLALAVEILAGVLTEAGYSTAETAARDDDVQQGLTLIAIDVARFRPVSELARDIDELAAYVQSAPLLPGAPPIALPGELGHAATRRNRKTGIALTADTRLGLHDACRRLGVRPPTPIEGQKGP
jgi:hydroxycarboxylate dehydrogenase B